LFRKYSGLRKIIKIGAIRSHILKLQCTKFGFGWGPQSPLGELWIFRGFTSKRRGGEKGKEGVI